MGQYGSLALCLAALAACGFPKPADVPECRSASDCKSLEAPFCIAGSCVAACQASSDCQGLAGTPFCQASSGKCVACLDASVCSADKPVCDATAGACRGCARDEECPGGICIEADGTCVADSDVVFVDSLAGRDTGVCTRTEPCATLAFAISQVPASHDHIQIKILSGTFALTASVSLVRNLYLEGSDTVLTGPAGMSTLLQNANVTLSHIKLQPNSSGPVITVDTGRTLRLFDVQTSAAIDVNGGGLDAEQTSFTSAGGITCTAGTLTVQRSGFDDSPLTSMTCVVSVRRTRFDLLNGVNSIFIDSGVLTFENNLIVQANGGADSMTVGHQAPGSTVRFSTFVSTTVLPSDGVALGCSSPIDVSSNIFAYNSMNPLVRCDVRYSLIDSVALSQYATGAGSKQGDRSTFFVDLPRKDFHLSVSSPALGAAEPGLGVSEDFDGAARPSPAGSPADMGAFEAR